jgi:hypothetical protein
MGWFKVVSLWLFGGTIVIVGGQNGGQAPYGGGALKGGANRGGAPYKGAP